MHTPRRFASALPFALSIAAAALPGYAAPDDRDNLAPYYGFQGLEIVKINPKAGPILVRDMNGDGLNDLVAVDNRKNRIDIYYQKKDAKPTDEVELPSGVNEFPDHWRFKRESITVDRGVEAVVPCDYDGDGLVDLIYAGNSPAGVVFVRQTAPGTFKVMRKQAMRNLGANRDALAVVDLLGDSAPELVTIVDGKINIMPMQKDVLGPPVELSAGNGRMVAFLVDDFDGNGTNDIVGVIPEDPAPLRAWFTERQDGKLVLGPQVRFEMPPIREATPVHLPNESAALLGVVERPSARAAFYRVGRSAIAGAGQRDSSLVTWSFEDPANRKRRVALADINADGLTDLVATNTLANTLMTYRQDKGKGISSPIASPSFADLDAVVVAPTKDGAILFSLSEKEGVVGRSTTTDGNVSFPMAVQLGAGRMPVAINLVQLGEERHLAVVAKDGRNYVVELVPVDRQDDVAQRTTINLGAQSRNPNAVVALDADQDGLTDLLVFTPEKPMIMLQAQPRGADGTPPETPFKVLESKDMGQFGLVQAATGDNTLIMDVDGDGKNELLVADRNYVRALSYEPNPPAGASPGWQVVTQMNAKNADAKLVTVAQLGDVIVAGDRDNMRAILFRKDKQGRWNETEQIQIPGFKFNQIYAGRFAGDDNDGLLAVGDDSFALVKLGGERIVLDSVGTWSSDDPRQVPHELVVGDLNGDGFTDVVVLDGGEQMAQILSFSQAQQLMYALGFKVFETRLFSGGDRREYEPSMGVIADVTGDGLNDLLLLAHDRVLIYPQSDGTSFTEGGEGSRGERHPSGG